jgi:hypothetical protein
MGARGVSDGDEPLAQILNRTLAVNEERATDILTDLLAESAPTGLARENIRDFVQRNVLPDSRGRLGQKIRPVVNEVESFELRGTLRALVAHTARRHGITPDQVELKKGRILLRHRGKRFATLAVGKRDLTLSLGPAFGPCFAPNQKLNSGRVEYRKDTYDKTSGRFGAMKLWLSDPSHLSGATKAIDTILSAASKKRR